MIGSYIKQIISTFTFALLLLLSFKFIGYFFRRNQRIKSDEANMIFIFTAQKFICLRLKKFFRAFWGNLELVTIWKESFFLQSVKTAIHY
jgi:hypothetical protein